MAVTLDQFLAHWGFCVHPFDARAVEDAAELGQYFIANPCFDWLLGRCRVPESAIVFANRGAGKTTLYRGLHIRLGLRSTPPPLILTVDDFTPVLRGRSSELVTLEDYLALIRRRLLQALSAHLLANAASLARLQQADAYYQEYLALLARYCPRESRSFQPPSALAAQLLGAEADGLGVKEWLTRLSALVDMAGLQPIYCLIDAVDELHPLSGDAHQTLRLIAPLLNAPWMLHATGISFVFFLPAALHTLMLSGNDGRLDRTAHTTLTWTNEQLRQLLRRRIAVASSSSDHTLVEPQRTSLDSLCLPGLTLEDTLCAVANGNPRRLLTQAAAVIAAHLRHAPTPSAPIDRPAVEEVLGDLPASTLASMITAATTALFAYERSGLIRIGTQKIVLNLSKNQRTILECLWSAYPDRVSYRDLTIALYGRTAWDDSVQRESAKESLQRTISRLKRTIEANGTEEYIRLDVGHGYRLVNTAHGDR